jgi:thiamine kinase-like enzyme
MAIMLRFPSHAGLRASPPEWTSCNNVIATELRKKWGQDLLINKFDKHCSNDTHGCYQILAANKIKVKKFVKIIPSELKDFYRDIDQLQGVLSKASENMFAISPMLEEVELHNEGVVGIVYEYIDHKYFEVGHTDINSIIEAIAKLHLVYSSSSANLTRFQSISRKNGELLNQKLVNLYQDFPNNIKIPKDIIKFIGNNSDSYINYYDKSLNDSENCSMVHGDLNFGNIIFDTNNPALPIILDFEDSLISWLPQNTDIATIIQRFLLAYNQKDFKLRDRICNLLTKYEKITNNSAFASLDELWDTLRFLSLRALGRLCINVIEGIPIQETELNKFVQLHAEAGKLQEAYS